MKHKRLPRRTLGKRMTSKKRNRSYNTKRTKVTDSEGKHILLRSSSELKVYKALKRAGLPIKYETKKLPYVLEPKNYIPDFEVKPGVFFEVKGYLESKDRTKLKAVKKNNPEVTIKILFDKPNTRIYKGSKTTYAEWAEKNGFEWCQTDNIPDDWLK